MNIYVNNIYTNINTCPLLRTASRITIKNTEKTLYYLWFRGIPSLLYVLKKCVSQELAPPLVFSISKYR